MPSMVTENYIDAKNITLNAEGFPLGYCRTTRARSTSRFCVTWRAENRSGSGFSAQEPVECVQADRAERDAVHACGSNARRVFQPRAGRGNEHGVGGPGRNRQSAFLYGLFNDQRHGRAADGRASHVRRPEPRHALAEHAIALNDRWTLLRRGARISRTRTSLNRSTPRWR